MCSVLFGFGPGWARSLLGTVLRALHGGVPGSYASEVGFPSSVPVRRDVASWASSRAGGGR